jgi:hypothetical protein
MRHLGAVETKEFVDHPFVGHPFDGQGFVGHPLVHWTKVQSELAYILIQNVKGGSLATPSFIGLKSNLN